MSTAVNDYLENASALAEDATEGPWLDISLYTGGRNSPRYHVTPSYDYEYDIAKAQDPDNAEFIAASRTLVPTMAGALLAIVGLAEWHETKALKAMAYPGEGRDAEMRAVAQAHEDAARLIRRVLEAHLAEEDDL